MKLTALSNIVTTQTTHLRHKDAGNRGARLGETCGSRQDINDYVANNNNEANAFWLLQDLHYRRTLRPAIGCNYEQFHRKSSE